MPKRGERERCIGVDLHAFVLESSKSDVRLQGILAAAEIESCFRYISAQGLGTEVSGREMDLGKTGGGKGFLCDIPGEGLERGLLEAGAAADDAGCIDGQGQRRVERLIGVI